MIMGAEISKSPSDSPSDDGMSLDISARPENAPLTLCSTKFAADLREKVKAGALTFMSEISNDLPGGDIAEPIEARKYLSKLIQEVTLRVMIALEESKSQGLSLKDTKNLISEASRVNDTTVLLSPRSFSRTSLEEILSKADDDAYWRFKIAGAVRSEIVGVKTGQEISEAFEKIILDPDLRQVFQDVEGYRKLSHLYARGSLLCTQQEMSRVCKDAGLNLKKEFGWTVLPGTTHDLKLMNEFVTKNFESLKGVEGYRRFAEEWAGGRMQKAHSFVSVICKQNNLKFEELGWNVFLGTIEKFDAVVKELNNTFNQEDQSHSSLKGIEGYKTFAIKHADENMLRGHQLASSVCKFLGHPFKELGWFQFPGSVERFEELTNLIKRDFEKLKGAEGQKFLAETCKDTDLKDLHRQVKAICRSAGMPFEYLEWSKSLDDAMSPVKNIGSSIKELSQILYRSGKFEVKTPDWVQLAQQAKETQAILAALKERNPGNGSLIDSLRGMEGYKSFAREFTGGQMLKAFTVVSSICKMEGERFEDLGWGVFVGSVDQYECIHDGIVKLRETDELDKLITLDISDRLPQLMRDIQELSSGHKKILKNVQPKDFYSALPEKLSSQISKQHFSVGYLRLDVDGESVYFDSNPERVCGYLLHKYGLIDRFIEGRNLHVRANDINRINLDFFIESKKLFVEYHPLSISEIYAGVTLEQAGLRKTESIKFGKYSDCRAVHISDFDGLYDVLTKEAGVNISLQEFKRDLAEAQAYGYRCDEIHENGVGGTEDEDAFDSSED
jgi:hypothetical protein